MILDLREFEDFPARALVESDPGEIAVDRDDVIAVEKVTADLNIQKSGQEFYCQGTVSGLVKLECARCLTEFSEERTGDTDFIIAPQPPADEREADVIDDEDYVFLIGDDLRADVTGQVRQSLILALPMKPLCRADCLGLCASCGANRNETPCDCEEKKYDSRWEGLSGLARE